ncbi:hypothetical protein D3C80_1451640 [compost metagenome]
MVDFFHFSIKFAKEKAPACSGIALLDQLDDIRIGYGIASRQTGDNFFPDFKILIINKTFIRVRIY